MSLAKKIVMITGASRGVGRALTIGFAKEGAVVVAVARTLKSGSGEWEGSLEETVNQINQSGGTVIAIACDVTQEADVESMVNKATADVGPIDVLINNAGLSIKGSIVDLSTHDFDRVIAVNLRGPFLTCKFIVPSMIERSRGNIINLGSRQADWVDASHIVYGPSKAALNRFSQNMAEDLKPFNIAVNAMSPGLISSYMTRHWDPENNPHGLVIEPPEVVVPATLWLAQQDASFTGRILLRNDFQKTWP